MLFKKISPILLMLGCLTSCGTTDEIFDDLTAPDYVSSSKAKNLEIPPDLSELEDSNSYQIPGEARSYKDYLDKEKRSNTEQLNEKPKKVIANPDGMRIIKSGNLRWLLVEKEPDILWPHIQDFWEDLGFKVVIANKRTGIIETQWMDTDDIKLERNTGALSKFDKWLDSISGLTDKRKFRTRVEIGENGFTEIYLSQRSLDAVAEQHERILESRTSDYSPEKINRIQEYKGEKTELEESRDMDDYEIDSELLTRLMIKLGATDFDATNKISNPELVINAELVTTKDDIYIRMNDPYERAWRRLGLALDIIGFVIEDKNRSEGIYYARYNQMELPKENSEKDSSLIDKLIFWGDDTDQKENTSSEESSNENETNPADPNYTGIEAPEIKPINEDYLPEENDNWKSGEEETWLSSLWPKWGDEDKNDSLPVNERRYRVRIKPSENNTSIVYIDYSNGQKNLSPDATKVLKIISEYLK